MKHINLLLTSAALTLLAASCAQDDVMPPTSGDGNLNLTVQLPGGMGTRAFADGKSATQLSVVVYDSENNTYIQDEKAVFAPDQLTTTVSLNLAAGRTYNIAFFAHNGVDGVYTLDTNACTVTVDYSKMTTYNSVDYDCFYTLETIDVKDAINKTVRLNRPVAQINWGTNDLSEGSITTDMAYGDGAANLWTKVSVKDVDNVLNLISGETSKATGFDGSFEFGAEKRPNGENYPVDKYEYLSMQYLLVPNTSSSVIDLKLTSYNTEEATKNMSTVTVAAAPVQANYRTNIYGALLTRPADFTVEKLPGFAGDDFNMSADPSEPVTDENGVYLIKNQSELAWLANQVNDGANMEGKTFSLQNDIYMVGEWTPIGGYNGSFDLRFSGVFHGNGHTIHNMVTKSNSRTGFFGFLNGKVDNLHFDNAKVTSNHWAGVVAGYSDNETGSCVISNCTVKNSTVILSTEIVKGERDNGDKGGLIIGYMCANDQVIGCEVTNCTLQGYRDLGGIIGYSNGAKITNNKVNGLKIFVDNSYNYKNYTSLGTGGNDANNVIG